MFLQLIEFYIWQCCVLCQSVNNFNSINELNHFAWKFEIQTLNFYGNKMFISNKNASVVEIETLASGKMSSMQMLTPFTSTISNHKTECAIVYLKLNPITKAIRLRIGQKYVSVSKRLTHDYFLVEFIFTFKSREKGNWREIQFLF